MRAISTIPRALLAAALMFLSIVLAAPASAGPLTKLAAAHLSAIGLADRDGLDAFRFTGTYNSEFGDEGVAFRWEQDDAHLRFEIVFNEDQTPLLWSVTNEHGAWQRSPGGGDLEQLTDASAPWDLRIVGDLLVLSRKDLRRGMSLAREIELEGHPYYQVRYQYANGEVAQFFFDAETHLLRRVVESRRLGDRVVPVSRIYSDYREVDGVSWPHQVREESIVGWRSFSFDSVEIGAPLSEERFESPVTTASLQNN